MLVKENVNKEVYNYYQKGFRNQKMGRLVSSPLTSFIDSNFREKSCFHALDHFINLELSPAFNLFVLSISYCLTKLCEYTCPSLGQQHSREGQFGKSDYFPLKMGTCKSM